MFVNELPFYISCMTGISSFGQSGGHASLSLYSQRLDEDRVVGFERGKIRIIII